MMVGDRRVGQLVLAARGIRVAREPLLCFSARRGGESGGGERKWVGKGK